MKQFVMCKTKKKHWVKGQRNDWMQKWHLKVKLLEGNSRKERTQSWFCHWAVRCVMPSYNPSDLHLCNFYVYLMWSNSQLLFHMALSYYMELWSLSENKKKFIIKLQSFVLWIRFWWIFGRLLSSSLPSVVCLSQKAVGLPVCLNR